MLHDDIDPAHLSIAELRSMTPSQRLHLAVEMSQRDRAARRARLRAEHPDASDRELTLLLLNELYGPEIARQMREAQEKRDGGA